MGREMEGEGRGGVGEGREGKGVKGEEVGGRGWVEETREKNLRKEHLSDEITYSGTQQILAST